MNVVSLLRNIYVKADRSIRRTQMCTRSIECKSTSQARPQKCQKKRRKLRHALTQSIGESDIEQSKNIKGPAKKNKRPHSETKNLSYNQ
jgi:hypothetical protein